MSFVFQKITDLTLTSAKSYMDTFLPYNSFAIIMDQTIVCKYGIKKNVWRAYIGQIYFHLILLQVVCS